MLIDLLQFLAIANVRLEALGLKIATIRYEIDEKSYYALINTKAADAGIATNLDEAQVGFFKALVDEICSNNGAIQQMDARNFQGPKKLNSSKVDRTDETLKALAQQVRLPDPALLL